MEKIDIKLKSLPVLWTTCDKSKDRHAPMAAMLSKLGLQGQMINGPITNPYPIGVSIGYKEALTKYSPPFLILEDDATLVNDVELQNIKIPVNSDAVYLGTSIYGRIKKSTVGGGVIAANVDETYIRVFNMLSFHAVLYTSKNYVDHVVSLLDNFLVNPVGGADDCIAESMWQYNVYALKNPIFYQKDGRSDQATKIPINCLL